MAHCAVNPDNIILTSSGEDTAFKLSGFADSQVNPTNGRLSRALTATPYTAPEVQLKAYNCEADAWALGSVLFSMLTGHPPGKAVCLHKIVGVSQVFAS